jgi:2-oxoglutarate ferredoxin oxidoreductase subunit gamma
MSEVQIKISGFGGQGVVLAGIILARAACLHDGKNATQSQSYGPEARGGAARSEVVISDSQIDYPKVEVADVLVAMSQEALDRHIKTLKDGGILLVDGDLVKNIPAPHRVRLYRIPSTRVAADELKRRIVANMVMLGAIVGMTSAVSNNAIKTAARESVPAGTEELNIKALELGIALAKEAMKA